MFQPDAISTKALYSCLCAIREFTGLEFMIHDPLLSKRIHFGILFSLSFVYFWLRWVFIVTRRLSPVQQAGAPFWLPCVDQLLCVDFSLRWLLLLQSTGSGALLS